MRNTVCLLLIFGALTCLSAQPQESNSKRSAITLEQLKECDVIGRLGVPLGMVVEIQAVVVAGRELRWKQFDGRYLIKIESVNGRQLDEPEITPFSARSFAHVKLANDSFELYKMKTGKKATSLDSEEITELEKGYVGQRKKLVVYETGGFHGIPKNLPKDVPVWQDVGFGFSTDIVVLSERQ